LVVGDFANNAQFQPPQMAVSNITITPVLPEGAQAFEISPGEVKVLTPERVPGGTRITLEQLDTTSLILCTTDLGMYDRLRSNVESVRFKAVPLAIEQAELLYQAVAEINGRLAADGHQILSEVDLKLRRQSGIEGRPPDVEDLLALAQESIKNARDAMERQDYAAAWSEARRAGRPLRHIMHGHWQQAYAAFVKAAESINPERPKAPAFDLKTAEGREKAEKFKRSVDPPLLLAPTACPPCISFYTLPEHYIWVDWIKGRPGYRFGRNRVPSGNFDDPRAVPASGWADVSYQLDGIISKISTAPRDDPKAKRADSDHSSADRMSSARSTRNRAVKMEVKAERPEDLDTVLPAFLDFPVAAIRSPAIRVEGNNLIRISVLVKRPYPSAPGMGGIIVRDSIGGETFEYRSSSAIPAYSRVVLFRKAPADGNFTVTLGLAGYGEAYFDDFRVEVVEQDRMFAAPDLVQGRRPARSAPRPGLPAATLPAEASRPTDSRRQQR
jgi:hypothetical protein